MRKVVNLPLRLSQWFQATLPMVPKAPALPPLPEGPEAERSTFVLNDQIDDASSVSDARRNNLKGFKDFCLRAQARMTYFLDSGWQQALDNPARVCVPRRLTEPGSVCTKISIISQLLTT